MKGRAGFTLIEVVVSLGIFVILGGALYGVLDVANDAYARDKAMLTLGQQVRNGMDRMIREIRESSSSTVTLISADNYQISFDAPGKTDILYYLNDDAQLVREYPADTIRVITSNIIHLKFTKDDATKLLNIELTGQAQFQGTVMSFPLDGTFQEQVRLRNE